MNLPAAITTVRWLAWDTFRQARASRLFLVTSILTAICAVLCLGTRVEEGDKLPTGGSDIALRLDDAELIRLGRTKAPGRKATDTDAQALELGRAYAKSEGIDATRTKVSLAFGLFGTETRRDKTDAVRYVHVTLGGVVADTLGLFLVLVWTAGFLPTFLDPAQASVLLAKPVPRWMLVVGKYIGVVAFVGVIATGFVFSTWLALGLATGVFDARYLLTAPLLTIHFAVFYAFSALMGVWSRSTVLALFATLVFWAMCWGTNFARHAAVAREGTAEFQTSSTALEAGYWLLPKPADMSLILYQVIGADGFVSEFDEFRAVRDKDAFHPAMSLLASLAFGAVMLGLAARELEAAEY